MGKTTIARTLGSLLLLQGGLSAAYAGEVSGISLHNGPTGTRAEIALKGAGQFKTIALAGPDRLVVDLPDAAAVKQLHLPPAVGIVKAVRTGQPVPGTFRVVFDLASSVKPITPHLEGSGAQSRLVIEWPDDGTPVTAAATPAAPKAAPPEVSAAQATSALTAETVKQATTAPVAAPKPVTPSVPPQTPASTEVATTAKATTVTASGTPSPAAILAGQPVAGASVASVPSAQARPLPAGVTIATGRPTTIQHKPAATEESAPIAPQPKVAMRAGMRPLVIAIDAGHGGQDSGAIGPTGKFEKNVTLAIARELARQIDATPGMKSYLTRNGDYFIPLNERAVKARAAHADIFISVHADAAENRSASGSSVYVLSLKGASSQRARWLADKENSSDLVGGVKLQAVDSTLGSVLIDLAQSGRMSASESAANQVLAGLKQIGNAHKDGLEKANFAVLRTSDMPAMLVETAYISNYTEERQLSDPAFQRRIAGAVLGGVETYFTRQPPPGTLFAARAQLAEANSSSRASGGSP